MRSRHRECRERMECGGIAHASRTHRLLTDKLRTHAHQESGHYQKGHLSSARAQHGTFLTHDHVARAVARVWRDTRVAAAASRLNSRPAARLRTSDAHEASHPLRTPSRLILLLLLFHLPPALPPSSSYRIAPRRARERDRTGGVAPTERAVHPYHTAARTVHPSSTCRDAVAKGMRPPRHGAPLAIRADFPLAGRPVGRLTG